MLAVAAHPQSNNVGLEDALPEPHDVLTASLRVLVLPLAADLRRRRRPMPDVDERFAPFLPGRLTSASPYDAAAVDALKAAEIPKAPARARCSPSSSSPVTRTTTG